LVFPRIVLPLSKLKTVDYLYRYQGKFLDVDAHRFLDNLNRKLKPEVEQIAFAHTQKVLNDNISVVFYDMTTLYFETSDEDDLLLRHIPFTRSLKGFLNLKHQNNL